ncbi:hypothetical protein RLOC_00014155 [Lonchura striata]|uniref:Uncharacterized protein n=1 Tax=Lonchura striata TaxID=40157 RepID=A0A218UCG1_9PASE|nr:hypothetical protein RLOC_00014155 [Lonchura striata domestica]
MAARRPAGTRTRAQPSGSPWTSPSLSGSPSSTSSSRGDSPAGSARWKVSVAPASVYPHLHPAGGEGGSGRLRCSLTGSCSSSRWRRRCWTS